MHRNNYYVYLIPQKAVLGVVVNCDECLATSWISFVAHFKAKGFLSMSSVSLPTGTKNFKQYVN